MEGKVFTGTIEELASNDELMAVLAMHESYRGDLENMPTHALFGYVIACNAAAYRAQKNVDAAIAILYKRMGQGGL